MSASCFFSASFMARDASQTSVVPLMRALMPVPEPPPVTWMVVAGCFFMYSSAQRCPSTTIVSEPFTVTVPARAGFAPSVPAARVAAASAIFAPVLIFIGLSPSDVLVKVLRRAEGNACSPGLVDVLRAAFASLPGGRWFLCRASCPAAGDMTVTTPKRFRAVVALGTSTTFSAL